MNLLALLACNGGEIREIAEQPFAGDDLIAVFPPDGAMWLVGEVPVAAVLGAGAAGTTPTVVLTLDEGAPTALDCVVGEGGNVVDCGAVTVNGGDVLTLDVTLGDTTSAVETVGRQPTEGLAWSMLDGMSFTALGSGGSAVTLANSFLGLGNALLAIDGYDGTAGTYEMYGGQSVISDDGLHRVGTPGLVLRLTAEIDDEGALTASAPTAWCPVYLENGANHLLLVDVAMEGRIVGTELTEAVLTATVPALTLEEVSEPLGLLGGALLDAVTLDVDLDGDGTYDAASVRLDGAPASAILATWAG